MGCCHVDKAKFSLHHTEPGLFHSSQWSPPGITTLGYTLYRLALASLMLAGIIAHIIDFTGNNPGYKWLIYMTNQVNWSRGGRIKMIEDFLHSGNIAADTPLCSLCKPCHS